MLFPQDKENTCTESISSKHLLCAQETWGKRKDSEDASTDGWCQLSLDSNEINNAASPFDDIGYLASDVNSREFTKGEKQEKTTTKGPSLGDFLDTTNSDAPNPLHLAAVQEVHSRRGRREKSLSKATVLKDDPSLGVSTVMAPREKTKGGLNLFDKSKNSLGFGSSKNSSKNKNTKQFTLGSLKNSSRKGSKSNDSSKSSFGLSSALGSSKTNDDQSVTSRTRNFSSMFPSKGDSKHSKNQDIIICDLQGENRDLSKQNEQLQSQLTDLSATLDRLTFLQQWRSLEELAQVTTELCQAKSLCEQANREITRLDSKLELSEKLIDAKERTICNLESAKNTQEKRITSLEVKCLKNGLSLSDHSNYEDNEIMITSIKKVQTSPTNNESIGSLAKLQTSTSNDQSFASFAGDDLFEVSKSEGEEEEDESDKLGAALSNLDNPNQLILKNLDVLEEDMKSECTKISGDSSTLTPHTKPNSWLTLDTAVSKAFPRQQGVSKNIGMALEDYMGTRAEGVEVKDKSQTWETDTWAQHTVVEDALGKNSSMTPLPIPAPPLLPPITRTHRRTHSAPTPAGRKRATNPVARVGKSKSPGTRRRLKDVRVSNEEVPTTAEVSAEGLCNGDFNIPAPAAPQIVPRKQGLQRSNSLGNRRARSKSPGLRPQNASAAASNTMAPVRRKLKASASFIGKDGALDQGSNHSAPGRGRRSRAGREAVSASLDKAIGLHVASDHGCSYDLTLPPLSPKGARSKILGGIGAASDHGCTYNVTLTPLSPLAVVPSLGITRKKSSRALLNTSLSRSKGSINLDVGELFPDNQFT
jgi:hypothetical protein